MRIDMCRSKDDSIIKKEKIENPDIKVAFLMSTESPTPCGILS